MIIYDLIVIGGGPAGYAAAIRAGQLGKRVVCVEADSAGGTCLNWGCIPSKALLKSAELYETMLHAKDFGFSTGDIKVDFEAIIIRSRGIADKMRKGVEGLLKKNKVNYVPGHCRINAPGMVEVTSLDGKTSYLRSVNILIATGCKPKLLPNIAVDGKRIMTSREVLSNKQQPKSIVILGGGAIGVEFAYFFNTLGSQVTLIETLPQILPNEDHDVAYALEQSFKKRGMTIYTKTYAKEVNVSDSCINLILVQGDKTINIKTEHVLLAVGVTPNTKNLFSERMNIDTHRGFIKVDDRYKTNLNNVYAAGDVTGPPWLAHVATYESLRAVNAMFGIENSKHVTSFPRCTYCQMQVASIGMTEIEAKQHGINYKIGKFPFTASGKAVAINQSEGFVKLIIESNYNEIIGAHIIGYQATEMIAEISLAMNLESTVEEICNTIHPHPTLSESIMEAAAMVQGRSIHI